MSEPAQARRLLHTNYNCVDIDGLERWYSELFATAAVMRTVNEDSDGIAFGLRMSTSYRATFLYDHRGPRRTSSLELVRWMHPPTIGRPYAHPWERGIQSCAYTAPDLDLIEATLAAVGGIVERRGSGWLLLRDPEGVRVEVYQSSNAPPEQVHLRVVTDDLESSAAWWGRLGLIHGQSPRVAGEQLWPSVRADGHERHITGERALVAVDDPSLSIVLTTWSGPAPNGPTYGAPCHQGLYRFALAVDDVQEAYAALRADGIARQEPHTFQLPGTKLTDGLTILFLRDPDNILVELVQRPRSHFR